MRHKSNSQVGKVPWGKAQEPTPVFLPGESHGQRSLVGYSPRGCKDLDTTEAIQHSTEQMKQYKETWGVKRTGTFRLYGVGTFRSHREGEEV